MKKIILTAVALMGLTATAQVKIGTAPLTLASGANFQVEGASSNQFVIMQATGNVGIGTTTPAYKLSVLSDGGVGTGYTQGSFSSFGNSNTGASSVAFSNSNEINGSVHVIKTASGANGIGVGDLNLVAFNAAAVPGVLTLKSNGNVGIGTTAPTQKLDVVGEFRLDNASEGAGKVLISDATGLTSWGTPTGLPVINSTAAAVAAAGDVFVSPNGGGVIVRDTAGVKWRITVSTTGVLTTTATSN